ncbi:PREDICTED: uncharacterized protein LOC108773681 [Cyphomyrmex costatus]|uniref:Male-enhanced antigen 1 n=1 Tax=Cyphomyrmex costatus TaxID=456900 RepID=A0A195CR91_9HYME|nr:PREDICTED: uncharacterized protein LOC108773681 [Cyphomyrmex costatus]KYN03155.1 hypothetical protein ALC62_06022 [Cyphomyrmex costatus]
MAPEPTQEPIKDNLTVSNTVLDTRVANDEEDSDDEEMILAGYLPLSQVATDAEPILGEEENDEWLSEFGEPNQASSNQASCNQASCNQTSANQASSNQASSNQASSKQASSATVTKTQQSCSAEVLEVWSCPHNRSDIDLDANKIKEVKSVMASITIPESCIPQWANAISEEQWKEQLLIRIKQMQNKDSQS